MKLVELETLQEVRLNGLDVPAGEVVELEPVLAKRWIELGLAKHPGSGQPSNPVNSKKPVDPEKPENTPEPMDYNALKAKAKELGVEGYTRMKKEELADAVAKAEAAKIKEAATAKLLEELQAMTDDQLQAKAKEIELADMDHVASREELIQAIVAKVAEVQ